jgi:hypothetical protein
MLRKKSIACHEDIIVASFSSSDADDHESWGADQEHAPEAHAFTQDTSSSSVMLQHW